MRAFVREYGRIAGLFAAGSFVLSLCIGLLSRNPFGTALLRALLLALVFAGLGAGLQWVVRRWLPEMVALGAGGPASGGEGQAERAVDIVLPGEGYTVAAGGAAGADAPPGEEEPVEFAGEPEEAEELPGAPEEPPSPGAEVSEEEAPLESLYAEEEPAGGGQPSAVPGPEESPPVDRPPPRGRARAGRDALPEIAELAPPGKGQQPSAGGTSSSGPAPGGTARVSRKATPEEAMRGALGSEDPESLAKAIRTVLKRDERG